MESAALERFIENLPPRPYCSENPRFGVYPCRRDLAIERAYIQPNAPWKTIYLAFDVDQRGAAFVAEDVGLPSPTFGIVNPKTAHAHLLYELSDPVYPGRSNKANWLLSAVRGGLTRMLSADLGYHGPLVQNPLNCRWRKIVTDERYGLCDLASEIPEELLQPQRPLPTPELGAKSSRNCHLFEAISRIAYSEVKLARDRKAFHQWVLEICRTRNVYSPALPEAEVRAVARSIAEWTWKNRDTIGSHWRRGVLRLGPIVEQGEMREHAIRVRQQAGAEHARVQRTLTLKSKIKAAVDQLSREGKRVTVTAIARSAHAARNTVYQYLRESQSEDCPERLFSDVQQNEHFQDNTADPLTGRGNPGVSRLAANGAENAAAA